ncbi:MAG: STAS domain-containing protein [Bacteroidota bacterium]
MALEIKENQGIFEILGKVSSQNLGALRVYFELVLEVNENIIISLERVIEMDTSVALFFEGLYKKAAMQNKAISIVGKQNEKIARLMNDTRTDYILSADRV